MLRSTLSALLVSVASRYADISPSDVGIGIDGGRLVLDDVQLRTDLLNGPHLPIHLHHGRAGRLRVNVPWGALSSAPVHVYLENVHLIASPKPSSSSSTTATATTAQSQSQSSDAPPPPVQGPWHQTNAGRLLFNLSLELYGLKLEYRHPHAVGVLSVASVLAHSAGPDWRKRFASLIPDLHRARPDASAVAMRKVLTLSGVHFVMIPINPTTAPPSPNQHNHHNLPDRNLDLSSFESKKPILDGASISLRLLLCMGATVLPAAPNSLTPGLHAQISVQVDEPNLHLTARQLVWLDQILQQALALPNQPQSQPPPPIPPPVSAHPSLHTDVPDDAQSQQENRPASHSRATSTDSDSNSNGTIIINDDVVPKRQRPSSLLTVWEAIVSENSDETVDDAAIALGLWKSNNPAAAQNPNGAALDPNHPYSEHLHGDSQTVDSDNESQLGSDTESESDRDEDEGERADRQFARKAVSTAAECGGTTWEIKVRTTDNRAWDQVDALQKEVQELKGAKQTSEKAMEDVKEVTRGWEETKERNEQLGRELKELERNASEAGKDKDRVIHELEKALADTMQELAEARAASAAIAVAQPEERDVPGEEQGTEESSSGAEGMTGVPTAELDSEKEEEVGREEGVAQRLEAEKMSGEEALKEAMVVVEIHRGEPEEEEDEDEDEDEDEGKVKAPERREMRGIVEESFARIEEKMGSEGLTLI